MEIAVIYWSGTGNTKMMAEAVAEGIAEAGAQKQLLMIKLLLAAVPWAPKYWKKQNLNPSLPWLKII